jgi:hypothetical protein
MAAQTGLLPTPPTPAQINPGLSLWLDEKRGSRHGHSMVEATSIKLPATDSKIKGTRCGGGLGCNSR